jgi:hypothetical protein
MSAVAQEAGTMTGMGHRWAESVECCDLLFKASSDTMLTIAADPKHLGAKIGITSVLHTWGSAMTHHPHVHMIVTGGGISEDGSQWIASQPDYLVPVEVLSALFRGRMLGMLIDAHAAGRLQFFGNYQHLADRQAFRAYLGPLWKTDWFVYAKRPFAGPEQVLAYRPATPTASPSPIVAWSQSIPRASPSPTRITA